MTLKITLSPLAATVMVIRHNTTGKNATQNYRPCWPVENTTRPAGVKFGQKMMTIGPNYQSGYKNVSVNKKQDFIQLDAGLEAQWRFH